MSDIFQQVVKSLTAHFERKDTETAEQQSMGVYDPLLGKVSDGPSCSIRRSAWHNFLRTVAWSTLGFTLACCALNLPSFPTKAVSDLQDLPCEGVGCERSSGSSVVLDASDGFEDDATILSE
jgi:hypothetical protein